MTFQKQEKTNWQTMDSAPRTGRAVRLLLKDGFGTYPFQPVGWSKVRKMWVNVKTGNSITAGAIPIGWMELRAHVKAEYGEKNQD